MSSSAPVRTDLEAALRELLGDGLTGGDAAFAVDGMLPEFVATPASVDELASVLAAAGDHGAAVVPWGGGRHMGLGNAPARYDVALRTGKLDRVIEHEPADLTITVEAGTTMGALQELLREHGQFLPIDAPTDATVGGVLASGVSGPSRHAYGLPRDWLLGCRVAQAGGVMVHGGGRVVKNVAGYDLPKLFVGSLGTLGVIVEATFKVSPLPPAQETLVVHAASVEAAASLVFAADERSLSLRAAALRAQGADMQAVFWLAGPPSAVDRTSRELHELATGAVERLEGRASEPWWSSLVDVPTSGLELRASLPPSAVAGFIAGWEGEVVAYPTTGLVLVRLEATATEELAGQVARARALAEASGGTLVVASAPAELKKRLDVWGESEGLPLMRRLKQQFDSNNTLNPGRFVGGL
ncbi:MAG: FAD-binding oxidoreductase [Dehalococcoidia bacterium]